MTLLVDFETRSRCDLKESGGRIYAEDPSTEVLCAVAFDTETGDLETWLPGDAPPAGLDDACAAHNADGFDRFIAQRFWFGGRAPAKPWIDTSIAARRAGLPGALDALGTRWLGIPKDSASSKFTKGLSTCRRPSGKGPDAIPAVAWKALSKAEKRARGVQKALTPEILERVVRYCTSDVEIMAHGWEPLQPFISEGVFGGWEADVLAVDRIVNDRGICFDSDLARALLEIDERAKGRAIEAAAKVCGWTTAEVARVVGSHVQFSEWCGVENAQSATIDALLAAPDTDPRVRALAEARRSLATIAAGKLRAGLERVSPDGRLRDSHRYYGAHTGRWSGRGMQLQNLPRPEKRFEKWGAAEVDALVERALRKEDLDPGEIMIALRACLTASPGHTLAVSDFSGVEARATAWAADDRAALDVFASGRDVYKVAAINIFLGLAYDDVSQVQRTAGKMAELACGYQGGDDALIRIAMAQTPPIDLVSLAAQGLVPKPRAIVDAWRELHAPIVQFWYRVQAAFLGAVRGRSSSVAGFDFVPSDSGADVAIFLPSGRPIIYNSVREGRDIKGRPTLSYQGTTFTEHIYGGKITENIIQAFCRDLLADALVRAEEAGLCPVLDVHDEIACDVPESAEEEADAELDQIMTTLPEWAEGFPVGAKGHHGRRYRK